MLWQLYIYFFLNKIFIDSLFPIFGALKIYKNEWACGLSLFKNLMRIALYFFYSIYHLV